MGLGLFGGGVAVSRYLAGRGAKVTVTDFNPDDKLRESIKALQGTNVSFHLGGHEEADFQETDLIVVNPGVANDSPYLQAAILAGVPLESEMNLFFKLCPAKNIIGVTGSNGKTTTTALIGEVLRRIHEKVWVGGNIGNPLIGKIDEIKESDTIVLELSSFQLEHLGAIKRSPGVSVVMNLTPNHLDRHGTMEVYTEAKRQIVAHQAKGDWKILNRDDETVRGFADASPSANMFFSLKEKVDDGISAQDNVIKFETLGFEAKIDVSKRLLPGWFNLQNMAAATAAVFSLAEATTEMLFYAGVCEEVFTKFPGVEHRLEFVGQTAGVKIYNDSIATNPESTIAALETLPGPVVLLAGGYDKKLPYDGLARAIEKRVRVLVLTGQTADSIEQALEKPPEIQRAESFDEAVRLAGEACTRGDTLLFSPASASFDQFRNFAERGRRFKKIVAQIDSLRD